MAEPRYEVELLNGGKWAITPPRYEAGAYGASRAARKAAAAIKSASGLPIARVVYVTRGGKRLLVDMLALIPPKRRPGIPANPYDMELRDWLRIGGATLDEEKFSQTVQTRLRNALLKHLHFDYRRAMVGDLLRLSDYDIGQIPGFGSGMRHLLNVLLTESGLKLRDPRLKGD